MHAMKVRFSIYLRSFVPRLKALTVVLKYKGATA